MTEETEVTREQFEQKRRAVAAKAGLSDEELEVLDRTYFALTDCCTRCSIGVQLLSEAMMFLCASDAISRKELSDLLSSTMRMGYANVEEIRETKKGLAN